MTALLGLTGLLGGHALLGSALGNIIAPFAKLFGWVLAFYYGLTHNYGWAIVLLTLTVMVLVFPLTRRGTRSMMRMQILQPELMKIRNRYKANAGQSAEERQANRTKLNEEMMALYRENNVSPTGGCLPMVLQFPIFIVLYDTIRGMTTTTTKTVHGHTVTIPTPQYISPHTALYHNLVRDHGQMYAWGINLADSVRTHQPSWVDVIPYVVIILIAVALQYVSIWQITNRNPAAKQANPQMQAAQKFMPLIFVFFYIVLPAGVGVYFIVSSAFRIGQQEWMYKHDPMIKESIEKLKHRAITTTAEPKEKPKGVRARLRALAEESSASLKPAENSGAAGKGSGAGQQGGQAKPAAKQQPTGQAKKAAPRPGNGAKPASQSRPAVSKKPNSSSSPNGSGAQGGGNPSSNGGTNGQQAKPSANRSQSKRPRRPR